MGLDKLEFSLNTTSLLDNVQNFFTKGFSDDSDFTSDKSYPTQANGGGGYANGSLRRPSQYPSSTGTQRRKLPTQPNETSQRRFSNIFNSTVDKSSMEQNSSTTSDKQFNVSIIRTAKKKTSNAEGNYMQPSNYSSSSPPHTLSRGASIQSSINSGVDYTQKSSRKPSFMNRNYYQSESPTQAKQLENDNFNMDVLSYNSRPSSSIRQKSNNIYDNQDYSNNKNDNGEKNFLNRSNDKRKSSINFNDNIVTNTIPKENRRHFYKHDGDTPRDRWLRAYEFVKQQLPNVSGCFFFFVF